MSDNRGNTINYVNKQEIKNIKQSSKKISLKDLYKKLNGSVAAVLGFISGNKLAIYLGGRGEDELIEMLAEQVGKLKGFIEYGTYSELEGIIAQLKIEFLEKSIDVISVVWNLAMANPVFATILISALIALGVYLVGNLALAVINKVQKEGKVKTDNKTLSI